MAQAIAPALSKQGARANVRMAAVAWLLAAVYYFYQYSLRSAPSVMMPQFAEAFGLGAMGVASIVGLFYTGTRRSAWLPGRHGSDRTETPLADGCGGGKHRSAAANDRWRPRLEWVPRLE